MSHRIAVFNHSPELLKLYKANLTARGFDVFVFEEALTTQEQIRQLDADLFILGNVRGYDLAEVEFLQELRTDPEVGHIPILICSTAPPDTLGELIHLPDVTVLTKPFETMRLVECVQRLLKLTPSSTQQTAS